MIALLDVNVLVALFDSAHIHHDVAHSWFGAAQTHGWATCALTENAFVRVLSNPAYPGSRTTIDDAAGRLRTFCAARDHVFWTESVSIREQERFLWNHVQGHRQLTDVYLLALAVANGGRLATFDSSISIQAVSGSARENLETLTT